jgi:hypothetical protein
MFRYIYCMAGIAGGTERIVISSDEDYKAIDPMF